MGYNAAQWYTDEVIDYYFLLLKENNNRTSSQR
jgi:hypothetical protein